MRLSLAARLALSSILVLPVILGFSAYALDRAFQSSLRNAEREALRAQLYSLLGAAEPKPGHNSLELPTVLAEPRFNRPLSGLFGVVTDTEGQLVWQSESAPPSNTAMRAIAAMPPVSGNERFTEISHEQQPYFALVFDSLWEINDSDIRFRFIIFHSQQSLLTELASYREALWQWLGGIALLIILAQWLITHWGLLPLRTLAQELKKFQQGNNQQLEGRYPEEIAPVITNLNELLQAEQAQRQRYKNTLSDLAHSLKTPLAIVRAELEQNTDNAAAIDEQISNMAAIIQHQLQRATLKSTTSIREKTPLSAVIHRLTGALAKVYREKSVQVEIQIDTQLHFPGDESDALEIFGNLLENAFKYCEHYILVSAQQNHNQLVVSICDDGSGVPETLKQTILSRGARADTSVQGQGIGLAVTTDILSSYDGQLQVVDCKHRNAGGAEFIVSIPL